MSTTLVSIEEYLDTAYSPDREYVDGIIVERNAGEFPHSNTQSNLIILLRAALKNMYVLPEQRVRTKPGRTRIPDVCVAAAKPESGVLEAPPLMAVEILSRRDETSDVMEKLQEYADAGVSEIWLIDPIRRKAYRYAAGLFPVSSLSAPSLGVDLPLDAVFEGL